MRGQQHLLCRNYPKYAPPPPPPWVQTLNMKWPITCPAYFRPVCAVLKATISFQKKNVMKVILSDEHLSASPQCFAVVVVVMSDFLDHLSALYRTQPACQPAERGEHEVNVEHGTRATVEGVSHVPRLIRARLKSAKNSDFSASYQHSYSIFGSAIQAISSVISI